MIFRRIKAHIEKENWFAVFIDFLIVVVGVFIGIQVANWNDARAESQLEASYLAALKADFGTVITELENDIARYETIAGAMTFLLEQSRLSAPDASLDALNDAATMLTAMEGTPIVSDTYSNLTGSGDLAIIKSQAVRNTMASFFGKADVVKLISDTHELQLVNIFQPYIINNLDYTMMFRKARGLPTSAGFEPDLILSALPTAEFRSVVAVKWDTATDIRGQLLAAVGEARAVEALLTKELEQKK